VSVQDTGNTFRLRVNLVQVHVIVRGNAGKPVEDLHKEDFQLFDNGKLQSLTCNTRPVDPKEGKPLEKQLEAEAAGAREGSIKGSMQVPSFLQQS
jgi:hypothetical protein